MTQLRAALFWLVLTPLAAFWLIEGCALLLADRIIKGFGRRDTE